MPKFSGNDRPNYIYASMSDDVIDGKGGADLIYARAGNDSITGGGGNDRINGGWGNDSFIFGERHSYDTITDFSRQSGNMDVIVLGDRIDNYFVFPDAGAGVRVVTLVGDTKQGSITLSGVGDEDWAGSYGRFYGDMYAPGPGGSPLIDIV